MSKGTLCEISPDHELNDKILTNCTSQPPLHVACMHEINITIKNVNKVDNVKFDGYELDYIQAFQ